MGAEVEEQRVMSPHKGSWLEWRAVCYSHVRAPGDEYLPPWMGDETHTNWIDAQLDAIEHNMVSHSNLSESRTFDQILHGDDPPEEEPLLPRNRLRPHHAG